MSLCGDAGPPRATSGARYRGVPAMSSPTCRRSPPAPKSIRTTRPSSAEHHVLRLDVAVDQSGFVDRGQRVAQRRANLGDLAGGQGPVGGDGLREGAPAQELHPEADLAVDAGRAVDADDVGVSKTGQQPALIHDFVGMRVGVRRATQQLEGDLAIELGVPRAIDVAEGAAGDVLEDLEMPQSPRRVGQASAWQGLRPVHLGDAGDDPQRGHLAAKRLGPQLLECVPIDGGALADGVDQVLERRQVGAHARRRSIRRTSARSTAIRAALPVGLPSSCATSS